MPERASALQFVCVTRPDLAATDALFESACAARGLGYVAAIAGRMRDSGLLLSSAPRLMYRPAADVASVRLEKLLHGPDVASFHDSHFPCDNQPILLQVSGIRVARMVTVPAAEPGPEDFRTNGPGSHSLGNVDPPRKAVALACRAAALLRLEFAGVDLLAGPDGTSIFSEVNCPCHFADQQTRGGIDIAGVMVDYLLAKSWWLSL